MSEKAQINPRILSWARETAGLSVEEAAEKLGLKDTTKATAVEKLIALESGKPEPSMSTLQKAASVYRRPLITFFMSNPPARAERGEDFRTSASGSKRDNATLDALVRNVRARQEMLREVLEDEEEADELAFIGSASIGKGTAAVVKSIRSVLRVEPESQQKCANPAALFNMLRGAAEQVGVYVLLLGDVGSHHSDVSEDIFRGFALADKVAPFVVINDNDAVVARSFTLMHEIAHLWIGESGISGPLQETPTNAIERFCNDVAGDFLLPLDGTEGDGLNGESDMRDVQDAVSDVAAKWKVSEPAVAYKFVRLGWITGEIASMLFRLYAERWRRDRQGRRNDRGDGDVGGPSFYMVRRHRLGARMLSAIRRGIQNETLTYTRAGAILGVGPASVPQLLGSARARAG
jgi:Zn-dependent peptidase ImmA (M78 family)/transcriptional regulator with XRE-family HTH domain